MANVDATAFLEANEDTLITRLKGHPLSGIRSREPTSDLLEGEMQYVPDNSRSGDQAKGLYKGLARRLRLLRQLPVANTEGHPRQDEASLLTDTARCT